MSMIDFRQPDIYSNVRYNPFWIKSPVMNYDGKAGFASVMDDNEAVFASFPKSRYPVEKICIHEVAWNLITVFGRSGGTAHVMTLGDATIPTEDDADGATVSNQTANSLITDMDEEGSAGWKTRQVGKVLDLTPVDAAVPVLYVDLTSDGTVTTGQVQVYVLVSVIS